MNKVLFSIVIISCYWIISINCTRPSECELPREIGRCRAMIPAYYFNPSSLKCELFMYGGCGGNKNRFDTEEKCIQQCGSSSNNRNG